MTPSRWLWTSASCLPIVMMLFLSPGCGQSPDHRRSLMQIHGELADMAAIVMCLNDHGQDLAAVKSIPELLELADRIGCSKTVDIKQLDNDFWRNPYQWHVVPTHNGVTVFISSPGKPLDPEINPPVGYEIPPKEPFARIQLRAGMKPQVQYYDVE